MVEEPNYIEKTLSLAERQFLALVKLSITGEVDNVLEVCKIDWDAVYKMAELQSCVGVVFSAIELLQEKPIIHKPSSINHLPEMNLLMDWLGQAEYIKSTHEEHVRVLKQVDDLLKEEGIPHVFMKGLICGARYPQPELRTCGDIDFVVGADDFGRTLDALEKIGEVDRDLVHEHHGMAHLNGVTLEPHYKVHNYQNPKNDRVMMRMFEDIFPEKLSTRVIAGVEVPVFPVEFEGMFLVSHMVNHVYEEGLGLRQVMDFAMWLNNLYSNTNANVDLGLYFKYLERMHMTRAARVFTRICEQYLGVDHGIMGYGYTDKEIAFSDKMLADIMNVGNFGRGTDYGKEKGWTGSIKNYIMITKRCLRLAYLCPTEAYWWPISKLTRFWGKKAGVVGA